LYGRDPNGKSQISQMNDLVIRLADILTRHAAAFDPHRTAHMTDTELGQATEPLRRELRALFAEYGEDAVTQAALALPTEPPILH
jgi:hypothetical protein